MTEYRLLTLRQVAALFQIPEREARNLLRDGCLPGYKIGRLWRLSLDDLNAFIRKHENVPPDELRKAVRGANGVRADLDAYQSHQKPRSNGSTKINHNAREIRTEGVPRPNVSTWAPPWRRDD